MKWIKITILIIAILQLRAINASPFGAPLIACGDMIPQHLPHLPQPSQPKVEVQAPFPIFTGSVIQITIKGIDGAQFRGFFIQARNQVDNLPIGRFISNSEVNTVNCFGMNQPAATHSSNSLKNEVVLEWEAPEITDVIVFEFL